MVSQDLDEIFCNNHAFCKIVFNEKKSSFYILNFIFINNIVKIYKIDLLYDATVFFVRLYLGVIIWKL